MPRKVLKTINLKGGNKLTFEEQESAYGIKHADWYRNGKLIDNPSYKYYDSKTNRYRYVDRVHNDDGSYSPVTPIQMSNYEKLNELADKTAKDTNKSTFLRYPFGNKTITLKTKGRMNLATIPTNMLDSIAIKSGRSGTNIKQNLGLIGKESTFGGRSIPLNTGIWGDDYNVYSLVNNHAYNSTPEIEYAKTIGNILYGNKRGNWYDDEVRKKLDDDIEYQLTHGIKQTVPQYSDDYLEDAFLRYADNPRKYNYGQKNYVNMVNDIANEVWNDKSIQEWWNTQGKQYYEKGRKERKSLED